MFRCMAISIMVVMVGLLILSLLGHSVASCVTAAIICLSVIVWRLWAIVDAFYAMKIEEDFDNFVREENEKNS